MVKINRIVSKKGGQKGFVIVWCVIGKLTDLMAVCPLQTPPLILVAVEGRESLLQHQQLRGQTQS